MSSLRRVVVVSAARTPLGSLAGSLSSLKAPELGSIAIQAAIARAGIKNEDVGECVMGLVCQAGVGQAPARQAALKAGLPVTTVCTTINKVCASGMKSIILGAQSIMLGHHDCVVAGGFESMSNTPHLIPNARSGLRLGNGALIDCLLYDGLRDPFDDKLMGNITEVCAKKLSISRQEQDEYALNSYRRAKAAHEAGHFKDEICPVSIPNKKGPPKVISDDEEYHKIDEAKFRALSPAFEKDGTITAGNASKISDGASAVVIMAEDVAKAKGLQPIARIVGFGDAELAPVDFPIAPANATKVALKNAGLTIDDISYFEINEAFSLVPIANGKILGIPLEKINVHGGAVALGHPIGCSGARIVTTLANILRLKNGKFGLASICNGGGGASAIVIERL